MTGTAAGAAAPGTRTSWVPRAVTLTGGLLCAVIGVTVMIAWGVRATAVLLWATENPTTFNTALALTVTGAALIAAAAGRWPWAALVAGAFDTVLGLLVLAEYALNRGLGIDQLLMHAYLRGPGELPGRIAVNTAVCLTLAGLGLIIWAPWRPRSRPAAAAVAGSLVAMIAIVAAFGYMTDTSTAYGWVHLSAMPLPAALALIILAVALLGAAWQTTPPYPGRLPGWLPMPAGVITLALSAGLWLAIVRDADQRGHISSGTAAAAATVLGILTGSLVVLAVWLAQRLDARRRLARAEAEHRAVAEAQARASESRTHQYLDAVPVGVFILSPGGQPGYVNDEARRIFGQGVVAEAGQERNPEVYRIFQAGTDLLYPTERMPGARAFQGERAHVTDQEIHRPDGATIPVETWSRPVYGASQAIDSVVLAMADISQRKAAEQELASRAGQIEALNATLEERVRQRTVHLEQANRDLQEFAYSIAHDLRTPLRGMSGFAEALVEDYGDRIGAEGREFAERIEAASQHMATLIDDLLHLAQMSRAGMKLTTVDLSAEATAICAELAAREPGRRVRIQIEPGVLATADRSLIRSALQHLLGNAWKFTSGQASAVVEFGATAAEGAPVYFVRDNGAGFDPAYAGKLFQPFQRLHTSADFPGTGIGLASVRRIIERHGGRVWAEGSAGRGATFYFTLDPKEPD